MKSILSLNDMIDNTYEIYRQYFKSFIGLTSLMLIITVAIMYAIMIVLGIILMIFVAIFTAALSMGSSNGVGYLVTIVIGMLFMMIPAFSIMQLIAAGPINGVEQYNKGEKITFSSMFSYSFKKILYVFTSTIAYSLVLTLIVLVGIGIYYLFYITFLEYLDTVYWIVTGIIIGLITLAGLIWFGIKSFFYLPVSLCEKKHFFKAITGSFKLVDGQFKRIFWIAFSWILSYYVIYITLGGFSSIATGGLSLILTGADGMSWVVFYVLVQIVLYILQLAITVFVTPVQYITLPIIYFNERNKKYGDDLHLRLNELVKKQELLKQNG